VRENFSRPCRDLVNLPTFPGAEAPGISGRPSGAGFSSVSFHRLARQRVLTHTLKRCAAQNRLHRRLFQQPANGAAAQNCLASTLPRTQPPKEVMVLPGIMASVGAATLSLQI
jgi:hypothetical protein